MIAAYLVRDTDTYSIAEHTPPAHTHRGTPSAAISDVP
jgi:hypothetical protein